MKENKSVINEVEKTGNVREVLLGEKRESPVDPYLDGIGTELGKIAEKFGKTMDNIKYMTCCLGRMVYEYIELKEEESMGRILSEYQVFYIEDIFKYEAILEKLWKAMSEQLNKLYEVKNKESAEKAKEGRLDV